MKKVHVEVWSDFVCPWCWIAKRRFEKAVGALLGQVDVVVTTKAYRLAKGVTPLEFKTALRKKFGSQQGADGMMAAVGKSGASEGLTYNFDTMRFGDTGAAHALIKSVQSQAAARQLTERIFKAATTDGLDIFDRQVLAALAREVGIADTPFPFDSAQIQAEIVQDENRANQIANGVPLFLFNEKFYISGAQEAAVFQKALLQSAADAPEAISAGGGESCGIDGCTT